jgi:hypothetical protein
VPGAAELGAGQCGNPRISIVDLEVQTALERVPIRIVFRDKPPPGATPTISVSGTSSTPERLEARGTNSRRLPVSTSRPLASSMPARSGLARSAINASALPSLPATA